ncbi:hypothetical protein Dimus_010690 [Dionaea muscipula]
MVGRRGLSQRRVVVDNFDSRSSGPRHPVMFRGSPSPPTTFHRQPVLSPGPQARHLRSPSPLLRSCVDPDEFSTSEVGDGDSTEMTVTSEEEEGDGHRGEEDGRPGLSPELDLCPILENESNLGGSSSSISRRGPVRWPPWKEEVRTWSGEQGGEQSCASRGGVVQTSPQVRNLCSSCSEYDAITISGPQVLAEGLDFAVGRAVMELHRAFAFPDDGTWPVVAGDLCGPNLPLSCGIVGQGDGGSVSEEVRGAPVAREALRSQPTDRLRQPPSSPAGSRVVLRVELAWMEILAVVPMLMLFR